MNALLDTNVFIDYLGRKPPFFESAQRVVCAGFFGDAKLWVSTGSLKDAFYVLDKYTNSSRIQKALLKACEVIAPVALDAEESLRAARLDWADYEDCLVALCAEKAKADYIITRDLKGFERSAVPAISPEGFLSLLEDQGISYAEINF